MRRAQTGAAGLAAIVVAGVLATTAQEAAAHDLRGTALYLDIGEHQVLLEAQLPVEQLRLAMEPSLQLPAAALLPAQSGPLTAYLQQHLRAAAPDGSAFALHVRSLATQRIDDGEMLVAQVALAPPAGASARSFTLGYDAIVHKVVTHNVYVFVRHDLKGALLGDKPELIGFLHFQNKHLVVDRSGGSWWRAFRSVATLGMHHIAEGTDHLLFLLMLLLPAPLLARRDGWGAPRGAVRSGLAVVKIVSAFTVGHSLTLLLGAVCGVHLPERPVEVLIAVSIAVSAFHALCPLFAGRETLLAGGFGLVHGLAFSSALLRFGYDPATLWFSVLGFNLGVEVMQVALVLVIMPWLILLSGSRAYRPLRIGGALLGAVAACGWVGERAFGIHTPVPAAIEALASHTAWVIGALAALAVGFTTLARRIPGSLLHDPA